jgi:hypothetical protein
MKNISVIAFNSFGLGLRKLYTWGVNVYMLDWLQFTGQSEKPETKSVLRKSTLKTLALLVLSCVGRSLSRINSSCVDLVMMTAIKLLGKESLTTVRAIMLQIQMRMKLLRLRRQEM